MNRPLTPALSPSNGERVSEGRVRRMRARSWSEGATPESWRLSKNLGREAVLKSPYQSKHRRVLAARGARVFSAAFPTGWRI